jgi:hypothetical protein
MDDLINYRYTLCNLLINKDFRTFQSTDDEALLKIAVLKEIAFDKPWKIIFFPYAIVHSRISNLEII